MTLTTAATAVTVLLLTAFLALAVRAIKNPRAAAAGFGLPLAKDGDASFVRVYGSRNFVIAAAIALFLALGLHQALAVLTTCAIGLTVFDIALLRAHGRERPPLGRHFFAMALLAGSAGLWWLQLSRG